MSDKSNDKAHPKICILTDSFYPIVGGGEAHARLLAAELIKRKVMVFVLSRRRLKEFPEFDRVDGVEIIRVLPYGLQRLGKYYMLLPAMIRLIMLRKRYDIIYVCGLRLLGIIAVALGKMMCKKVVLRSESCGEMSGEFATLVLEKNKHELIVGIIRKMIAFRNRLLFAADKFLAISSVIKDEYIASGVNEDRIVMIPNGIDTEKYRPVDNEEKIALRARLGLPDKLVFVYTGKMNRGKGLELLLEVWVNIVAQYDNVHLYLVGSGDFQALGCENELRRYVEANQLSQHVTFTGYVENVTEYLQAADFFVIPSESESQCLSLIEALACELPAIATAAGGIVDVVEDGVNGLLVPVGDAARLQQTISNFVGQPEKARGMGVQGRINVIERFGIEKDIDDHLRLFKQLCNGAT